MQVVYDSSWGKAVFIVVCRGGNLLVCQRVDEFRLPAIRVLDSRTWIQKGGGGGVILIG